jgi:hypothetical protein
MDNETLSHQSFFQAAQERKLGGVAAAYLVIGFGLIEAADLVAPRLQLPSSYVDLLLPGFFFMFPVVLGVRWIVSGRGRPASVHPAPPLLSLVAITLLSGWLGVRALSPGQAAADSTSEELPLVILMDSHHPARVYDEQTRRANATNADVLSDVLLDLPIRRQRESIGPEWHRDEEVLRFNPNLIVIHWSGFRQEDGSGPRERLRLLISFFAESDTEFLIYSRAVEATLRGRVDGLLGDLDAEHPGLLERVSVFGLDDYGSRSWLSPLTTAPLKLRVKRILGIPRLPPKARPA